MTVQAVLLVDAKGRLIIGRSFVNDVLLDDIIGLIERSDSDAPLTHIRKPDCWLATVKHNDIALIACTTANTQAVAVFHFLHSLLRTLSEYIGRVDEESLKDSYILVYELLEEMVDFGIIQQTDYSVLKNAVTRPALIPTSTASASHAGSTPWRRPDIKHKKNEVYLDVIERVNLLADSNGTLLSCSIEGELAVKCYLSGMPDLKLGLTEEGVFDDVHFHQCVRLDKYDQDRVITFIPPDGHFQLMSYRSAGLRDGKAPLWLECVIERETTSNVEIFLRLRSQYGKRGAAHDIEVAIPVPEDINRHVFDATIGNARYRPEQNAIVWSIGHLQGSREHSLLARLSRPVDAPPSSYASRNVQMKFELPYHAVSGMAVRYLKVVEASGYQAHPWVRYVTRSGRYEVRMRPMGPGQ